MKGNDFVEYVFDVLRPHGPISAKAMFGGYGIYYDNTIIGIVAYDELYFKVDELTKPHYEHYGSTPFVYKAKTKTVTMRYMKLPAEILENSVQLPEWIEQAYQVSVRHKGAKAKN